MTKPDSEPNRRAFTRIPFRGTLTLRQDEHRWEAELLDISLRGMLIQQVAPDLIDRERPLLAQLQLAEDIQINMELVWRHMEGNRVGLECKSIDIESISNLRRLVELNLGDSQLLERELAALGD